MKNKIFKLLSLTNIIIISFLQANISPSNFSFDSIRDADRDIIFKLSSNNSFSLSKLPISPNYLSVDHGGNISVKKAYSDGVGIILIGPFGAETINNEPLNNLVYKYPQYSENSIKDLANYILSEPSASINDKNKATKILESLQNSLFFQEGDTCNDNNQSTVNDKIINGICVGEDFNSLADVQIISINNNPELFCPLDFHPIYTPIQKDNGFKTSMLVCESDKAYPTYSFAEDILISHFIQNNVLYVEKIEVNNDKSKFRYVSEHYTEVGDKPVSIMYYPWTSITSTGLSTYNFSNFLDMNEISQNDGIYRYYAYTNGPFTNLNTNEKGYYFFLTNQEDRNQKFLSETSIKLYPEYTKINSNPGARVNVYSNNIDSKYFFYTNEDPDAMKKLKDYLLFGIKDLTKTNLSYSENRIYNVLGKGEAQTDSYSNYPADLVSFTSLYRTKSGFSTGRIINGIQVGSLGLQNIPYNILSLFNDSNYDVLYSIIKDSSNNIKLLLDKYPKLKSEWRNTFKVSLENTTYRNAFYTHLSDRTKNNLYAKAPFIETGKKEHAYIVVFSPLTSPAYLIAARCPDPKNYMSISLPSNFSVMEAALNKADSTTGQFLKYYNGKAYYYGKIYKHFCVKRMEPLTDKELNYYKNSQKSFLNPNAPKE